ncbi:MAG: hypothetical protein QXQ18_00455 [Candidatus Aenigmatarchaeota archaeon]
MPILGYSLKSIVAERKGNPVGRIDISSTPLIKTVEERTVNILGKQTALGITFEFETEYKPDVAKIKMSGELLFASEDSKKILKDWKKEKKLPEKIDIEIKNFLFRKCLGLGLSISEELQLPPPILFPIIIPKEKQEEKEKKTEYIG